MKNRSRIALLMVALFMLCAVSITANQSSSKIITLVDDKQVTHYETDAQNVQELLTQLEITLGEKDTVEPTLDTEITDNMKITIERWKPTVSVDINGEHKTQKTEAKTVGEFLTSLGLEIKEGDVVEPNTQEAITDGLQITVKTKEVKTETLNLKIRPDSNAVVKRSTTSATPQEVLDTWYNKVYEPITEEE